MSEDAGRDRDLKTAEDLAKLELEQEGEDYKFPDDEPPEFNLLHPDCGDPKRFPGYSDQDPCSYVVPLRRDRYPEFQQALDRFLELATLRSFHAVAQPFATPRYWCWRVSNDRQQ